LRKQVLELPSSHGGAKTGTPEISRVDLTRLEGPKNRTVSETELSHTVEQSHVRRK
jgi:hypothetical protein